MTTKIEMEKWPSALGVTFKFQNEHGGIVTTVSLGATDLAKLKGLIAAYEYNPSPVGPWDANSPYRTNTLRIPR